MQTIEDGHEVIAASGKFLRLCNLEGYAVLNALRLRSLASSFDGLVVIIEAKEPGLRISLGHKKRGSALATAYISNSGTGLEFRLHVAEGRNPGADQIGRVSRTKECF